MSSEALVHFVNLFVKLYSTFPKLNSLFSNQQCEQTFTRTPHNKIHVSCDQIKVKTAGTSSKVKGADLW